MCYASCSWRERGKLGDVVNTANGMNVGMKYIITTLYTHIQRVTHFFLEKYTKRCKCVCVCVVFFCLWTILALEKDYILHNLSINVVEFNLYYTSAMQLLFKQSFFLLKVQRLAGGVNKLSYITCKYFTHGNVYKLNWRLLYHPLWAAFPYSLTNLLE